MHRGPIRNVLLLLYCCSSRIIRLPSVTNNPLLAATGCGRRQSLAFFLTRVTVEESEGIWTACKQQLRFSMPADTSAHQVTMLNCLNEPLAEFLPGFDSPLQTLRSFVRAGAAP